MRGSFALFVCSLAVMAGAVGADEAKGHPYQRAADPYMGDWQGVWQGGDGSASDLCAQIIALGKGQYQANLLRAFDTRQPAVGVLMGELKGDRVQFSGETAGPNSVPCTGALTKEAFEGQFEGAPGGIFAMAPVERLSPTLGAEPPEGAVVLFDGTSLDAWRHTGMDPRALDLEQALGGEHCAAYLRTRIWSSEPQEVQLRIGSDDGVKVWLNGEAVHKHNTSRSCAPDQDRVAVKLTQGWNRVMMKIVQGGGNWGACLQIVGPNHVPPADLRAALPGDEEGAFLHASDGFVLDWQVSGPYRVPGRKGEDLFDVGFAPEKGEAEWRRMPTPEEQVLRCRWRLLDNGAMEVHDGGIISRREFGDQKLHLEFRTPYMPTKRGQARGNSGVYLQGRYEVQILDSYGLEGADNECGGIYTVARPRVNMCAPPLQWQTYDIEFRAPRFDAAGKKTKDALLTVRHNGVLIHENQPVPGPTTAAPDHRVTQPGPLHLQDHGNPVQFRNIWVLPVAAE